MKFSIRRDLGLQLLALYLLFVGPVVLASLAFDQAISQRLENEVKAADLALARAIAQETNTTLDYALQAVNQLAAYPAVVNMDNGGMEVLFGNFMSARPDVNLVYRLDAQGTMVFHYPVGPGTTVGTDFSFRDYFTRAVKTRQPFVSKGRISPTTNQPVTTAVMPLWDDQNHFMGLVATNIKLESLSATLASILAEHQPLEGLNVVIIDNAGQIIAHPDPQYPLTEASFGISELTSQIFNGINGNSIQLDPESIETLYSYVSMPSASWGVIVSRPTALAFATPRAMHRGILLSVGVFLVVGLFFWVALSRQVLRPLERLAAFSQTIGLEENIDEHQRRSLTLLSERPDQIGHLIRSLTRMEKSIEARLNELSTLLETSAAVVSTLDPQTVLNRILEQVERLMGIRTCALLALDQSRGVFTVRASRGLSQRYADQLSISPTEPLSVSMRAIRAGEPIQVSDTENDTSFAAMRPRARSEGYRSLVAVPLNTQHAPPSVLLVYRPDPHIFSEREISLLTSFANHAAMAIENAELYSRSDLRLKEQTRRLEALIQSLEDGLILEDLQGRVLYTNRRISELVDLPQHEIIGAPVDRLLERMLLKTESQSEEAFEKTRQAVEAALNGSGPRHVELALASEHQVRYFRLQVFNVTDQEGMPIGRGQILSDITRDREIDRMKSSLISTVSHELRTPLAGIKGYASTLLADDVEWDKLAQREFLQVISNETDRLTKLVGDLLDMSRIEAGNLDVVRMDCDLSELVQRAAQRAHPQAGQRLQLNFPTDLPTIYVDPQRIEAVLRNLIENAAKYTEDDSPIRVSANIQSGQLIVRVKDEGPGIPAEHSQRIFESFYRLEGGMLRAAPGAGLGLAICHGFVKAHGGEIWSEPQARGACIAFSIPLEYIHNQPAAV